MTTTALRRNIEAVSPTRQRVMGILFLVLGLSIWFFMSRSVESGLTTTFNLNPGGADINLPDWQFQTVPMLNVLAIASAVFGGIQIARGFGKWTTTVLGVVVTFFVFGFLAWSAAGNSLNLAGMLGSSLLKAVPITLGAMSGILCERSGIINIAIEGMMLLGAMMGALVGSVSGNLVLGLLSAVASGVVLAYFLAWMSIRYKVDQIITGTVINIFATGITSFISSKFMQRYTELNNPGMFSRFEIPLLAEIPFFGPIFFNQNIFVYVMYLLLIGLTVALFNTRWGLRLRSVGEHPRAADTLGINVNRTRYMATMLGGAVAGFAGAYFTLGSVGRFDEVMTAGRGFIGLAAMIFGNWNPFGSFSAGLLFGFADSLASKLAILGIRIPSQFLGMAPYIATMIVLAGVVGRGQAPAAEGKPYEKE